MMDLNKICINCFGTLQEAGEACPHCGYTESVDECKPHQLAAHSILAGKYLVGRVLGEGGFGITYLGYDLNLNVKIAIKEYYPNGAALRDGNSTVYSLAGEDKTEFFSQGKDRFVREAQNLAKFSHLPGIVAVRDYFHENGTAYITMEFIEGDTLKTKLAGAGGKLPLAEVFNYVKPIMTALKDVHAAGLIHRDISPDNMIVTPMGTCKLIDFGAARGISDGNKSLSIMLKPGFAPEEQYRTRGSQGPWTDIYALCATIYRAVTGVTPDEAMERMQNDQLKPPSALGVHIDSNQELALMRGLAVRAADRWQSIDELFDSLFEGKRVEISKPATIRESQPAALSNAQKTSQVKVFSQAADSPAATLSRVFQASGRAKLFIAGGAVCAVILLAVVFLPHGGGGSGNSGGGARGVTFTVAGVESNENGSNLDLRNVTLTSEDLSELVKYRNLRSLTIGSFDDDVDFSELALLSDLRHLNFNQSANLTDLSFASGMKNLEQLYVIINGSNSITGGVTDLSPLVNLKNLHTLQIYNHNITDISALAGLTGLTSLSLYNCPVQNIEPLRDLTKLTSLRISYMGEDGLAPLSKLTELTELELGGYSNTGNNYVYNNVSDLTPLSDMTKLKSVRINSKQLSSLKGLEKLTELQSLEIQTNGSLSDLSPIQSMSRLESLLVSVYNNGSPHRLDTLDLVALRDMTELKTMYIQHSSLPSLAGLENCVKLESLSIYISGNYQYTDYPVSLAPLSGMTKLRELTVSSCRVTDFTPLQGLKGLQALSINWGYKEQDWRDNIPAQPNLSPLAALTSLKNLSIQSYSQGIGSLSPLSSLTNLTTLTLSSCKISDISALSSLDKLTSVNLEGNNITDWSPVTHVKDVMGKEV